MRSTYKLSIRSAEDFHHADPRWGNTTAAERIVLAHFHMETNGFNVTLPKGTSTAAVTYARVDLGRWICDCPWCRSAQNASREDHRFFCVECANAAVGGQWIQVIWPTEQEIADVENLLGQRHPSNQWFTPREATSAPERFGRETVMDLVAENLAHGLAG